MFNFKKLFGGEKSKAAPAAGGARGTRAPGGRSPRSRRSPAVAAPLAPEALPPAAEPRRSGKFVDPDIGPKGYTDVWGEHIHAARQYRSLAVFLGFVDLALIVVVFLFATRPDPLPIVVRVDDVQGAQVVDYQPHRSALEANDPIVPFFLRQFVYDHYQRRRAIGTERWRRSLYFLRSDVARSVVNRDRAEFVSFMGIDTEPERVVDNVELRIIPVPEPPYVADIFFDLVYQSFGTEVRREPVVASLRYVFADEISSESVYINPMGLVIIYLEHQPVVEVE